MSTQDPNLPPVGTLTGMDGMFAKTHIIVLILFGFCCSYIALILGIIGLITCKDPRAKQNALVVTIIAAVIGGAGLIANFTGALAGILGR